MSRILAASALAIALGVVLIACTAPEMEATAVGILAVDEILNEDGTCAARPTTRVPQQDLVYVVENTTTYHRASCRRLAGRRRTCTSRQAAQAHHYHRCPECKPA